MTKIRAVITDYIGTLTKAREYSLDSSRRKLHQSLSEVGFEAPLATFLEAYKNAHEKYRVIRYKEMREITNVVWVSETLNTLGYETVAEDRRIKTALNVFFQDYVETLELRPWTEILLQDIVKNCKLGLISNFTYTPVIYASLRKLGIGKYFNTIVVSEDIGWRKPHKRIFRAALESLNVEANETIFVGDSPVEDIEGAKEVGMKAIFVLSQFNTLEELYCIKQKPDIIAENLQEVSDSLKRMINTNMRIATG